MDHPDAVSLGKAAATEFQNNLLKPSCPESVGLSSIMELFTKYQTPVACVYLLVSWLYLSAGAFFYGPFLALGLIMYWWVALALLMALMPFKIALREAVFFLYQRTQRAYNVPTPDDTAPLADLGTERKRAILMKMQGQVSRIPALAAATEEAIENEYADNLEIEQLTGAPKMSWDGYFLFGIVFFVFVPFMTSLGVKVVVTLDIRNLVDVFSKLIWPLFYSGPEWSALKGAYMEVFAAAFWERRTELYLAALATSIHNKVSFLNSFI